VTATATTAVRCRVCGGAAQARLESKDHNRRLAETRFTYYACAECGSLSLPEAPADLDRFYPGDYYRLPTTRQELAALAESERYKVELVRRFVPGGRLLEIGPAVGGFAYLAKEAGYEVETVEMDAACCRFLREVAGVGVTHSADAKAVLQRSAPLQVVALWHVLEHLPDPMETLAAAAAALAPGGILVVAAPNPGALQFSVFGSLWAHLDAPRHLQLIPSAYLREQGARWGLTTVLETATDRGGLGWNLFGWMHSLDNLARSWGLRFPTLGARAVSRLARPVERTGLRGAAYTIVLRKEEPR
jgi:2-polyprenyl-3-methyl-5-hydroxy-6-metoxy-1,4-benzoquinol methylase